MWESTAVPEIREQAAGIAQEVLAAEAYTQALSSVLAVQDGAEAALRLAVELDPEFALAHVGLALLGDEWGAGVDIAATLAAAELFGRRWGDERERSLIAAVT